MLALSSNQKASLNRKPSKRWISQKPTALAVAKKVGYEFPNSAEGRLMKGIFHQAVVDLFIESQRTSAARHLQGWIYEAEMCGINSDWIRRLFETANVSLEA